MLGELGNLPTMTYCGGILVREGLVMFADTRTNAGVDNISTFRKLHVFKDPKKRIMAIATAGNLSISQSVLSILTEGYDNPETGEHETLMNSRTMFQAAQRLGHVVRMIHSTEGKALEAADVNFDVSFLFGGQIMGERMRLFMVYSAGNFIECTIDTPYLQIGEHKYGKPVLDRASRVGGLELDVEGHVRGCEPIDAHDRRATDGLGDVVEDHGGRPSWFQL